MTATVLIDRHADLSGLGADDHPQYLTTARGDARYPLRSALVAATHAALAGLGADDHPQYLTQGRGDARYPLLTDARLTDQRTPVDGSVTTAKIAAAGLAPAAIVGTAVVNGDARLSDQRTPVDGSVTTAKIAAAGLAPAAIAGTAVVNGDARLSDQRTPVDGSVTTAKIAAAGLAPAAIAGTAVITNDGRLSDARTPKAGSTVTQTAAAAALKFVQTGNASASTSTGGAVNLDNSGSTGAGVVIYSTQAAPAGRLLVVNAGSATFTQAAAHIAHAGTGAGLSISQTGGGGGAVITAAGGAATAPSGAHALAVGLSGTGSASASAISASSANEAMSAVQISGTESGRGTVKVDHAKPSSGADDANAAAISVNVSGVGTKAQGLFLDSYDPADNTVGQGTLGALLNLRNARNTILLLKTTADFATGLLDLTGRLKASDGVATKAKTGGAIADADFAVAPIDGQIAVDTGGLVYRQGGVWKQAGITAHGALTGLANDDHGQYHTDARGDARYPLRSALVAATHAALTGLGADDHPQYLTNGRGDSRYVQVGDTRLADARTPTAHAATHLPGGTDDLFLVNGYLAGRDETFPRWAAGGSATLTAQQLTLTYFTALTSRSVTIVGWVAGTAAAGATLARIGVFSVAANGDLALIGATANDPTGTFPTANVAASKALAAATAITRGSRYALGFLQVGATTVPTVRASGIATSGLSGIPPRLSGAVTGQPDLPTTILAGSVLSTASHIWAYVT